jgi:hypothetical protein
MRRNLTRIANQISSHFCYLIIVIFCHVYFGGAKVSKKNDMEKKT